MKKVYEILMFILIGIVAGTIATIKWIAPPGTEYKVGKIKVRGRGNTQTTKIEIEDIPSKKEVRRQHREARKQRRETRRKRLNN